MEAGGCKCMVRAKPSARSLKQKCRHCDEISSLTALELVNVITSREAIDENFSKMATFMFQCFCLNNMTDILQPKFSNTFISFDKFLIKNLYFDSNFAIGSFLKSPSHYLSQCWLSSIGQATSHYLIQWCDSCTSRNVLWSYWATIHWWAVMFVYYLDCAPLQPCMGWYARIKLELTRCCQHQTDSGPVQVHFSMFLFYQSTTNKTHNFDLFYSPCSKWCV